MSKNVQTRRILFPVIVVVFLLFQHCPTQPQDDPPEPGLLSVEYTAATEVWLRVQVPDSADKPGLRIYRDDSMVVDFAKAPTDTVVIDTGPTPNTTYTYHTVRVRDSDEQSRSDPLTVTTLPTTSHHFTWTIDTLGQYGSYLRDVAIVNEDNIWVVGNIETDSGEYNAAQWDGDQWHLMGIYSNTLDLYSIQYFAADDIWVTDVCSPIHWDGQEWTLYHLQNMGLDACAGNAIWGSAPDDVYFVGSGGSIVHYDGSRFTRMESGTALDLVDVTGSSAGVVAVGHSEGPESIALLHTNQSDWTTLFTASSYLEDLSHGEYGRMTAVTVQGAVASLISKAGVLHTHLPTETTRLIPERAAQLAENDFIDLATTGPNDLLIGGVAGFLVHYNGASWVREDRYARPDVIGYVFRAVAVTPELAVMVGDIAWEGGVVIRGRRGS